MNDFNYHNIFETKGMEYVVIIMFFLVLIPFWIILNRKKQIGQKLKNVFSFLSFENLRIPEGIFFGKNHTWAFMEKSGLVSVGVDDFLVHTTGTAKLRCNQQIGDYIKKGDLMAEIINDDKNLKIYSPLSGNVTKTNSEIEERSDLLYENPYDKGWIYKLKPKNWIEETKSLLLQEDTIDWTKNELVRFKDFVVSSVNKYTPNLNVAILQDGGELMDHTLQDLPKETWNDFQKDFLNIKD